jgi:hypothetical protein
MSKTQLIFNVISSLSDPFKPLQNKTCLQDRPTAALHKQFQASLKQNYFNWLLHDSKGLDRQRTYYITLKRVRATIVAVEKQ